MIRVLLIASLAFVSFAATGQQAALLETSADPTVERLASDLYALGRIANVAEDPGVARQLLLTIVDENISTLRVARADGSYQWASLQREEAGRVRDEKTIERVHTESELRHVTITGDHGYRVLVTVPPKQGVFRSNNRVFVRNVIAEVTAFDGKVSRHEIPVNAWVNPGDATGVALPDIGRSVRATAELGVESGGNRAVAEVALLQAKLVDDPANPYYPAVQRLLQIRQHAAERTINRGALKTTIDEALLSMPGKLEARVAEQERAAEERRQAVLLGDLKGSVTLGDATPDVLFELEEIGRLLGGTLAEQGEARERLATLLAQLKPGEQQQLH
jgi:hypothetical protein